jgi:hypothetical protein
MGVLNYFGAGLEMATLGALNINRAARISPAT